MPPTSAPMELPDIATISKPCSSSSSMTPICARPFAPPAPRASAMVGLRPGSGKAEADVFLAIATVGCLAVITLRWQLFVLMRDTGDVQHHASRHYPGASPLSCDPMPASTLAATSLHCHVLRVLR